MSLLHMVQFDDKYESRDRAKQVILLQENITGLARMTHLNIFFVFKRPEPWFVWCSATLQ